MIMHVFTYYSSCAEEIAIKEILHVTTSIGMIELVFSHNLSTNNYHQQTPSTLPKITQNVSHPCLAFMFTWLPDPQPLFIYLSIYLVIGNTQTTQVHLIK